MGRTSGMKVQQLWGTECSGQLPNRCMSICRFRMSQGNLSLLPMPESITGMNSSASWMSGGKTRGKSVTACLFYLHMRNGVSTVRNIWRVILPSQYMTCEPAVFSARRPFRNQTFLLLYYLSNRIFGFASESSLLFCLQGPRRRLNDVQIGLYLASSCEDKEITFYQDVLRLPPGHCMVVAPRKKKMLQYWALDPLYELRLDSDREYATTFRKLFTEAVRCRMRSAFPVGSALSGGLDSSAITCVAYNLKAKNNGNSWHTFSTVFDGRPECDEKPYINEVLDTKAYSPHFVRGDSLSPLIHMEQSPWRQDEPFSIPNLFLFWNLLNTAQQQGIRVFLDGHDGDTTLSHGEGYFVELANKGKWLKFFSEARRFMKRFDDDYTFWDLICRYGLNPFSNRILKHFHVSGSEGTKSQDIVKKRSIKQGFADRISLKERIHLFHWERSRLPKTERTCHYFDLNSGLIPNINEIINKTAAAFNISVALPFFRQAFGRVLSQPPPRAKTLQRMEPHRDAAGHGKYSSPRKCSGGKARQT